MRALVELLVVLAPIAGAFWLGRKTAPTLKLSGTERKELESSRDLIDRLYLSAGQQVILGDNFAVQVLDEISKSKTTKEIK